MNKKLDETIKVKKIIREIIDQANLAYAELIMSEKSNEDWKSYGKEIEGIYRSYYKTNDLYSLAMMEILSGKVENVDPEILDGNYGFRKCALIQDDVQETMDIAKEIAKKHGKEHARYYVKGLPVCLRWACNEVEERKKNVDKFFDNAVEIMEKQSK